jgi:hypothetical protein
MTRLEHHTLLIINDSLYEFAEAICHFQTVSLLQFRRQPHKRGLVVTALILDLQGDTVLVATCGNKPILACLQEESAVAPCRGRQN